MICLLTFDIEEWFQVENLKRAIKKADWETMQSSVEKNTTIILDLLAQHQIPATFFVLGWIAEKNPKIVRTIAGQGHEIGCHGYGHDLADKLSGEQIRTDIQESRDLLENITGKKVRGYRAPSFSINDQILKTLKELDFLYDSSFNPFKLNTRHGTIYGLGQKIAPGCYLTDSGLYELPLSTLYANKLTIPIGGGAYFRIYPGWLFRPLVRYKLKREPLYNFYLHPWEFEPGQPRIKNIKLNYKFRHYYGLKNTEKKFTKLLIFLKKSGCKFMTMEEYVDRIM